ncbi:MAG: LysE family translocator [Fusobacteriaceae bacterium]
MLLEGFKFGMLLQIAIGPVCMYIFSLGANYDFLRAQSGVLGVVLADGIYMALAVLGISSFIKEERIQRKFNIFGAVIVILFGLELALGYFGISILPKFNMFKTVKGDFPFFKAFFLTAANPMTILFWIGVFSTKLSHANLGKKETGSFTLGALLATLIFLSFISFMGTVTNSFLSSEALNFLNSAVGLVLIYFGIKKLHTASKKVPC